MKRRKVILGLKSPGAFTPEERKLIVEEYLQSGCNKQAIWQKYTGQTQEKGRLLRWMRQLGYDIPLRRCKLASQPSTHMSNPKSIDAIEQAQLKERIAQLEKALIQSELRATALETMIEIADKELKINIKKKSFTKRSTT